jgi:hypothetical protein
VEAFVAAVAAAVSREAIEGFYAEDIVQEGVSNLLLPNGVVRDFINLRAAYDKSRYVITTQSYDVVNVIASGNCVVLETKWTATGAVSGALRSGLRFRDGLVSTIRNYNCFDPFRMANRPTRTFGRP